MVGAGLACGFLDTCAESAPAPNRLSPPWWSDLGWRDLEQRPLPAPARFAVAMFLDPECPVANGYLPAMTALAAEFSPQGFAFMGVYADPSVPVERLRDHARDYRIGFQLVDDRAQTLARWAGAKYSSETPLRGVERPGLSR